MNIINYNIGIFASICLWIQAAIVICSCLLVIVLYARSRDKKLWPIVFVSVSHVILTLRAVYGVFSEVVPLSSIWGILIITAFLLTDYHLISLAVIRFPKLWRSEHSITQENINDH